MSFKLFCEAALSIRRATPHRPHFPDDLPRIPAKELKATIRLTQRAEPDRKLTTITKKAATKVSTFEVDARASEFAALKTHDRWRLKSLRCDRGQLSVDGLPRSSSLPLSLENAPSSNRMLPLQVTTSETSLR
jgi:hypothetical protein